MAVKENLATSISIIMPSSSLSSFLLRMYSKEWWHAAARLWTKSQKKWT